MQQKSSRGVQQHEVNAAADALVAERARPTVERVRAKIGGGSPDAVGPMLEAWFATLGPRLGVVREDDQRAAPPVLREALDKIWLNATSLASEQAAKALTQEREALAAECLELSQAREAVSAQQAALAQREAVLQESLELARNQLAEVSQRALQLQARLESAEAEVGAVRQTLADMVQEHAGERRTHAEQARSQATDLRQAQERAAAAERRLLEDVDRARQEAKQSKRELADAQQAHVKDLKAHEQANGTLTRQLQESQVEIAALRERLAGAETRTADLQRLLDAHGSEGESRLAKGKVPGKAGSSPQLAAKRGAGSARKSPRHA